MEVQKVDNITPKEFYNEFYMTGTPVVFKNASKVWKANGTFTPDWFRQNFGDRPIDVKGKTYTMREVMDLVVRGLKNKQIAEELTISVKTVEAHRAKIMKKMKASGVAQLVRMVVTKVEEDPVL